MSVSRRAAPWVHQAFISKVIKVRNREEAADLVPTTEDFDLIHSILAATDMQILRLSELLIQAIREDPRIHISARNL